MVIIFSPIYSSEVTYLISSFNLRINWWMLIPDAMTIPWIYRSPYGKTISVAFINNAYCLNRFSFDDHPSTSKFLVKAIHTNRKAVGSNNTSPWLGPDFVTRFLVTLYGETRIKKQWLILGHVFSQQRPYVIRRKGKYIKKDKKDWSISRNLTVVKI